MRYISLLTFVFIIFSCEKGKEEMSEVSWPSFRPRIASHVLAIGSKISYSENSSLVVGLGTNAVKATDFVITCYTGDNYIDTVRKRNNYKEAGYDVLFPTITLNGSQGLATSIATLERELQSDFQKIGTMRSVSGPAGNLVPLPYRTTGVKDFIITAEETVFGKNAGTSLNSYFSIYYFDPKQIINYQTKQLVWGYGDNTPVTTIDQWLSLTPMAQPLMFLRLNAQPAEPQASFVLTLKTADDKLLRDTVAVTFSDN